MTLLPNDALYPVPVGPYMEAFLRDKIILAKSGAVRVDFGQPGLEGTGGQLITMRRFVDRRTDSVKNDGTSKTPTSTSSTKDVGILTNRMDYFQMDDAARIALESQNQDAIINEFGRQASYYWGRESEKWLTYVLQGLFASGGCLVASNKQTDGALNGKALKGWSYGGYVDACAKLGTHMEDLALIITVPQVWAQMKKEAAGKNIEYAYLTDESGKAVVDENGMPVKLRFYDGKMVWLSDVTSALTDTSGDNNVYTTLICKTGSMCIAPRRNIYSKPWYKPDTDSYTVTSTFDFVPHVFGTKWNTSYPTNGPDAGDLTTTGNWAMSESSDNRSVGVIAYATN